MKVLSFNFGERGRVPAYEGRGNVSANVRAVKKNLGYVVK